MSRLMPREDGGTNIPTDVRDFDNDIEAVNDEPDSVDEEFLAKNNESLDSKEKMRSLVDALIGQNAQLKNNLKWQRTTFSDLSGIVDGMDLAILFVDADLNIRLLTPAAKSLFNIMPSDIRRPLTDISTLLGDGTLSSDVKRVLQTHVPIEREIEFPNGAWYVRRILSYNGKGKAVEAAVITFADITNLKQAVASLETAARQARLASIAQSRFLATTTHDIRQPLQTLAFLNGLLAKTVEGERAQMLVARLDVALGRISATLNVLSDSDRVETSTACNELVNFPINDLLARLCDEFTYRAQAQGTALRVVPCSLLIDSDPRLLEQMIRNLLTSALNYTKNGKVLLGCRRRDNILSVEIWDTGTGANRKEHQLIFNGHVQHDADARFNERTVGLGLSIVRRLAELLRHPVCGRSRPGTGSVFTIDIARPPAGVASEREYRRLAIDEWVAEGPHRRGTILVVEDDHDFCELLDHLLKGEGHLSTVSHDAVGALDSVPRGAVRYDLVIADYHLPGGMNGLHVITKAREMLRRQIPAIILTGDISSETSRDIVRQNCIQLHKPVRLPELLQAIQRLLPVSRSQAHSGVVPSTGVAGSPRSSIIYVVDDDLQAREMLCAVLQDAGQQTEDFETCETFLAAYQPGAEGCLLVDAVMPGIDGFDLLQHMKDVGHSLPAIMITGNGDVHMAVRAMQAGALDFIEKPISRTDLVASVERALVHPQGSGKLLTWQHEAAIRMAGLTTRERQIMAMVLAGHASKHIAGTLGISPRTVENHRASIMQKTNAKSLPELVRLALAAASGRGEADSNHAASDPAPPP